jgi:hypothetical protein
MVFPILVYNSLPSSGVIQKMRRGGGGCGAIEPEWNRGDWMGSVEFPMIAINYEANKTRKKAI